ncbi:MAG: SAM-dependent methyltransferase [Actinomycetota bacterium]
MQRSGARVVRLKGGDSFVLGRGSEELQACLAAGIKCEVVSRSFHRPTSVPAGAGIPLTHRGLVQGFTVVNGHGDFFNRPG